MPTPRALLAAALVAAPLSLATSAHAVPTCPQPGSTTLLTLETVVGGRLDLLASGTTICLYSNAAGIVVQYGPNPGHVEVWRTGDTLVDSVACARERVEYALDESTTDQWYDCWQNAHRIL